MVDATVAAIGARARAAAERRRRDQSGDGAGDVGVAGDVSGGLKQGDVAEAGYDYDQASVRSRCCLLCIYMPALDRSLSGCRTRISGCMWGSGL